MCRKRSIMTSLGYLDTVSSVGIFFFEVFVGGALEGIKA